MAQKQKLLKKPPKRESKLVGVVLPLQFSNYLSLYTIAKHHSKSEIVSKTVAEWFKKESEINSEVILINEIADQILASAQFTKTNSYNWNIDEFKEEISKELSAKGLPNSIIFKILNKVKWQQIK